MLTIEDIRNPNVKSGFDYVKYTSDDPSAQNSPRKNPFQAQQRLTRADGPGSRWMGGRKRTAEEAAQEYVDAVNEGKIKMGVRTRRKREELEAFRATLPKVLCACGHYDVMARDYYKDAIAPGTQGKWEKCVDCYRELERERQRSYRGVTPEALTYDTPSIDMGTKAAHAPDLPPVRVIRPVFEGPHDLYDVLLYDEVTRRVFRRKVGITARGQKRYADVSKTLGMAIKPYAKAITYPSKAKAEAAERARVEEIALTDKNWRRVAKEAFAPIDEGMLA